MTETEWVAEHFERTWPWLEAALASYPLATHRKEDVRAALESGQAQLWATPNAAVVVEVNEWPSGLRTLNHWLAGGDLGEIKETERRIEAYAREHGFGAMTAFGRRGWARACPGYREAGTQVLKVL